jgi:glycosyltransferase involved in cell wall biosynthesis
MTYRILQVASLPNWGGTGRYVFDLSVGLAKRGYAVTLACPAESVLNEKAEKLGLPCIHLQVRNPNDWWALPGFVRAIGTHYDVVHTHALADYVIPAVAARLARAPAVVMTRHLPHPFGSKRRAYLCTLLYDRIIAVSQFVRKVLVDSGATESSIEVVLNGLDPVPMDRGAQSRLRQEFGIPPEAVLVAAAGRVTPEKGFSVLLRAVGRLKESGTTVHCVIFGDGRELEDLRHLASELGIDSVVRLPGFRNDVAALWSAADIAVVPSVEEESFGFTLLEALAAGCPAIASRVGGIPELVTSECALLTEPGDVNGLAAAVKELASSSEVRQQMRMAAVERAKRFSLAATLDGVERVYARLLRAC